MKSRHTEFYIATRAEMIRVNCWEDRSHSWKGVWKLHKTDISKKLSDKTYFLFRKNSYCGSCQCTDAQVYYTNAQSICHKTVSPNKWRTVPWGWSLRTTWLRRPTLRSLRWRPISRKLYNPELIFAGLIVLPVGECKKEIVLILFSLTYTVTGWAITLVL